MKVDTEFFRACWIVLALLGFMVGAQDFLLIPACYVLYVEFRHWRSHRRMSRQLRAYLDAAH